MPPLPIEPASTRPILKDMNSELAEVFKRLGRKIQELGEAQNVSLENERFRVYQLSELSLQSEISLGIETLSGISFEVFNEEMFLTPDGSISVSDDSQAELEVYSLKDEDTLHAIYIFLRWRLNTIQKLGF